MSREGLVLGVDASTTACKVLAFDRDGAIVSEGRAPIELANPSPGAWEQDAASWWRALGEASRSCVRELDPTRLCGLAVANQRETFVVTDAHGRPLAPALTWMDHRCAEDVARAVEVLGAEFLDGATGKPPCTTPSVYKWMGQSRRDPTLATRVGMLVDVHGFLVARLTGEARTSLAAADPMGLVDMPRRRWSDNFLTYLNLTESKLQGLSEVGGRLGALTVEAAKATGLPAGLPVFAGAGDGQAAGLGAGITRPGRAYLNLGTAVVSGVLAHDYRRDRAFRTLFGASPGTYFLETDLQGGTFTLTWLCEKLLGASLAILPELEAEARLIDAGSDGLFLVPYWNGVMNPYWDDFASGILVGLRGEHGASHLYRAILEGIAFEQRLHTSGVEASVGRVEELVVMGGGASSDLWCQILADVLGKPILRSAIREATALGAAMIAAVASGMHETFEEAARAMTREGRRFEPGASRSRYDALYRTYRDVYPALRGVLGSRAETSRTAP
ncbi:MAG: hypothetical protein FJ096_20385 [Deltaproteobacteria bacterium]|nr:hypothetical protein [Deltaproteobacteria bacterium]